MNEQGGECDEIDGEHKIHSFLVRYLQEKSFPGTHLL
jgi:hypothetical protein